MTTNPTVLEHAKRRAPRPRGLAADCVDQPDHADADPHLLTVATRFGQFMDALGLDRSDPNLRGTEWRVARAYRDLLAGLDSANEPELRTFPNTEGYADIVSLTDVSFHSLCAHHFLPFTGGAHIAYLPGSRLVGLSKLARAVEFFARRPQVQERLTQQVADFLHDRLDAAGVMVTLEARHQCMEMRGVRNRGVVTTTTAVYGVFTESAWRQIAEAAFARTTTPSTRC